MKVEPSRQFPHKLATKLELALLLNTEKKQFRMSFCLQYLATSIRHATDRGFNESKENGKYFLEKL